MATSYPPHVPNPTMNPTMNPLKALRESIGLSQENFASATGVSRMFIVRAEQGVYSEPPFVLAEYLLRAAPVGSLDLPTHDYIAFCHIYFAWQKAQRLSNYGRLLEPYDFPDPTNYEPPFGLAPHPFIIWREDSGMDSQISVAKFFCVHPAVVSKFEKANILAVPHDLRAALLEAGYSTETLDSLDKAYYAYKDHLRKRVLHASAPLGTP